MNRTRKKTSDSSNIKPVAEITKEIKENTPTIEDLGVLVMSLQEKIKDKDKEIADLKEKLKKANEIPVGLVERVLKPDEKQIAEIQLEKLKEKAMKSELTLEETRKFEIFTKVKNAQNNQGDVLTGNFLLPKSEKDLLLIAASVKEDKPQNE